MLLEKSRRMTLPALTASFLACSASLDDSVALQDATDAPIITTLRLRDGSLAITSTDGGVRYGVHDPAGGWQANLTLDELEQLNPGLHELVQSAVADNPYIDARLDAVTPDQTDLVNGTGARPNAPGRTGLSERR